MSQERTKRCLWPIEILCFLLSIKLHLLSCHGAYIFNFYFLKCKSLKRTMKNCNYKIAQLNFYESIFRPKCIKMMKYFPWATKLVPWNIYTNWKWSLFQPFKIVMKSVSCTNYFIHSSLYFSTQTLSKFQIKEKNCS